MLTPTAVDARVAATLAHPRDVLTVFDCALDLPDRSDLEAVGWEGVLRVSDPWHSVATGIDLLRPDGRNEHYDIPAADPYTCQLDDFAGAVAGEHPPRLGRADALGQARTIDAVLRAAELGQRVALG